MNVSPFLIKHFWNNGIDYALSHNTNGGWNLIRRNIFFRRKLRSGGEWKKNINSHGRLYGVAILKKGIFIYCTGGKGWKCPLVSNGRDVRDRGGGNCNPTKIKQLSTCVNCTKTVSEAGILVWDFRLLVPDNARGVMIEWATLMTHVFNTKWTIGKSYNFQCIIRRK